MNVDAAAERIVKKIRSYMDVDENKVMTDEEQEEALVSILKILIEEVATLATVNELYERMKKDGHL